MTTGHSVKFVIPPRKHVAHSPEHEFISSQLDEELIRFAATGLLGVQEADRRRFDYACRVDRDCRRTLAAQVLWRHDEGLDKDLRTLLHDSEARLKVYLFRDSTRARCRIDEIL